MPDDCAVMQGDWLLRLASRFPASMGVETEPKTSPARQASARPRSGGTIRSSGGSRLRGRQHHAHVPGSENDRGISRQEREHEKIQALRDGNRHVKENAQEKDEPAHARSAHDGERKQAFEGDDRVAVGPRRGCRSRIFDRVRLPKRSM